MTRRLADGLLTLSALVGAACLVVLLAALVLDARVLLFRSGSMEPAVPAGSLGLAREVPAADLRVGDVVSVLAPSGTRVTHRVESLTRGPDGTATLVLRGDANDAVDPAPYSVRTADRLVAHVPGLGHVVAWLAGPVGMLLLGGYGALLLSVLLRPRRPGEDRDPDDPDDASRPLVEEAGDAGAPVVEEAGDAGAPVVEEAGHGRRETRLARGAAALVALLLVTTGGGAAVAADGWADDVTVTSALGTTATQVPVTTCRALLSGTARISWAAVPGATGYRMVVPRGPDVLTDQTAVEVGFSQILDAGQVTVGARFQTSESEPSDPEDLLVVLTTVTCL
ncbi:hypothetical protein [Nocardioides bruguierae]|uniref:hypothetical protein n=1 Tax=Nocardioides bruguierae TaxID=2945102 RepID=UPI002020E6A0|nr:hypothetical protein [Nocardioides bruguierae]MCL8027372.1 hypothetical protein [Nocardioides bruguierae]